MTPLLPEVRDELLAAAARRQSRRRPWRRVTTLMVGACAITGATAITAASGVLDLGSGTTRGGATYRVMAVTSGQSACLPVSVRSPNGRFGRRPSCTPHPSTAPLSHSIVYVNGDRLVTGIVRSEVAAVNVEPAPGEVELHPVEGTSLRYFHTLVEGEETIRVVARDREGRPLTVVDSPVHGPPGQNLRPPER